MNCVVDLGNYTLDPKLQSTIGIIVMLYFLLLPLLLINAIHQELWILLECAPLCKYQIVIGKAHVSMHLHVKSVWLNLIFSTLGVSYPPHQFLSESRNFICCFGNVVADVWNKHWKFFICMINPTKYWFVSSVVSWCYTSTSHAGEYSIVSTYCRVLSHRSVKSSVSDTWFNSACPFDAT